MPAGDPPNAALAGWALAARSLRQPYRVTAPMVLMILLVPCYIFIAELMPGRPLHSPQLPLDRALPLSPVWALVYGTLYLFLILLPVLVVRQEDAIRRTVRAYLFIWLTAYACFLLYPTAAPRPEKVAGGGFAAWGLRFLYEADPPFNCFPSLHVAHSFVSALSARLVNRRLGALAIGAAALVAFSTLFTKQHYVLDVVGGVALAAVAQALFLRGPARDVPELDRRAAPALALGLAGFLALVFAGFWIAYALGA